MLRRLRHESCARALSSPRVFSAVSVAAAMTLVAVGCGRVEPSRTPLSPPVHHPEPRVRPSSSRADEGDDSDEDRQEMEVVIAPDDDDGDDSVSSSTAAGRPSSSRAGGSDGLSSSGSQPAQPGGPAEKPAAIAASSCTAAAGAGPDCALLPQASGCLGASIAERTCESFGPAVDPRVGATWLACMRDPANGSACDAHRIVACGLRAVGGACVDGSYRALCGRIARACADVAEQITEPVCEQLIAAWKPERRPELIECLRHGCDTGAFGSCLP